MTEEHIGVVTGVPAQGGPARSLARMGVVTAPAELDMSTTEALGAALTAAFDARHRPVVLDLTGTRFCDCAGLGPLIRAQRRARSDGSELRLRVTAGGAVARLLALTGLDRVLLVAGS